ncbi:SIR2-like domain-containing protein [Enhydrobacter aerosaccus]|uniref:SIR2-like domain-containing protein n=1 Tax=Enhydrobacter aerosaccus TaxID=225324 RepID=A0A1T4LXS4_9HYPH|nr:SIR2 family protein [Enhydrobacter aerosaccus]SJZ59426.1 SIR2-like domain-containing protein [Enhydrobacter aerosaccus]
MNPLEIQRAVPGRLRSLLRGQPDPILLVGAGASVSSGIPAAGEAVERIAKWRWCLDNDRLPNDPSVRRADYWPWLTGQPWFSADVHLAEVYPDAVKNLLNVANDRRVFFEDMIHPPVHPNRGYKALANILHQGWISTVLTTNFDECVQNARVLVTRPHHLVVIKTPSDLVRFSSAPENPQLVYLHGSVEHLTDKNLAVDVQSMDSEIVERVRPLLRDHPIIVVGYRGGEPSVMRGLFLDNINYTNNFHHGIYWCVLDREIDAPMPPMVADLARAIGGNFTKVPISGFDNLFEIELYSRLIAEGAQPTRRSHGYRAPELPFDMTALAGGALDGIDRVLLFTRLREYATVLNNWAPDSYQEEWTLRIASTFNLLITGDDATTPSVAGWLLFANDPSTLMPSAFVHFRARGPEPWLRQCLGDDVDLARGTDDEGSFVEVEIRGNLWSQLDQLTELLSRVNRQFRLKQEVSRQVRSYSPLALKEMIVNALVHRDYTSTGPVEVDVTPERIITRSLGGLVDPVVAQIYDQELQALIKSGRRSIKGYRNPVISDLFYGGGQMDHTGSGLSDMWKETINNNGDVDFGPEDGNKAFKVEIHARPEAVDDITNTAIADESHVARFTTNLLPIHTMPDRIWHAGTTATYTGGLFRSAGDLPVPPGHVQDGRFFTLYDLEGIADSLVTPFDAGDVETATPDELIALPNGENILIKLLGDAVLGHCRALGMQIDFKRKRAHFPRFDEGHERRITYKARYKRATRTVVKARTKRNTGEIAYYEHKALSIAVAPYGAEWCIVLSPGYAFTRNGFGRLIGNELINSLSTRRAAKDFNSSVHNDLAFWQAMLADQAEGIFSLKPDVRDELSFFAPNILISNQLPGASLNSSALDGLASIDADSKDELDELDEELAAMADMVELDDLSALDAVSPSDSARDDD